MPATTSYDTGTPTFEVRIHRAVAGDALAPDEVVVGDDEDCSIASASIPARGIE